MKFGELEQAAIELNDLYEELEVKRWGAPGQLKNWRSASWEMSAISRS